MFAEKTFVSKKIEVGDSPIAGKGMFAKEPIAKGEIIMRWGGEFFTTEEAKKKNKKDFLVIQIDDNLWSIEKRGEFGEDYHINHSCDSNTWMADGRTFVARRNIHKGEEITVDYALFESEDYVSKWACNCGWKDCRKKVTGKDYLIKNVREKYNRHFSPVIQRKINKIEF